MLDDDARPLTVSLGAGLVVAAGLSAAWIMLLAVLTLEHTMAMILPVPSGFEDLAEAMIDSALAAMVGGVVLSLTAAVLGVRVLGRGRVARWLLLALVAVLVVLTVWAEPPASPGSPVLATAWLVGAVVLLLPSARRWFRPIEEPGHPVEEAGPADEESAWTGNPPRPASVVVGAAVAAVGHLIAAVASVWALADAVGGAVPGVEQVDVARAPQLLQIQDVFTASVSVEALGSVVASLLALAAFGGAGLARSVLLVWTGVLGLRAMAALPSLVGELARGGAGATDLAVPTVSAAVIAATALAVLMLLGSPSARTWFRRARLAP